MSRTRQILAVVAVTMALCADHVAAARPAPTDAVTEMAGRLVSRLTQTFRRVVPSALRTPLRQQWAAVADDVPRRRIVTAPVARPTFSPFHYRIPPPTT